MSETLTLAIAADPFALELKVALQQFLLNDARVGQLIDSDVARVDGDGYPHAAVGAAHLVTSGVVDRGIVLCESGTGVAIAASKVPGARAATAHDVFCVRAAIEVNNAQVLALGSQVVGIGLAKQLVDYWLDLRFDAMSSWGFLVTTIDSVK